MYVVQISKSIFNILSFDRRSSWNNDVVMAIVKIDLLVDLMSAVMSSAQLDCTQIQVSYGTNSVMIGRFVRELS